MVLDINLMFCPLLQISSCDHLLNFRILVSPNQKPWYIFPEATQKDEHMSHLALIADADNPPCLQVPFLRPISISLCAILLKPHGMVACAISGAPIYRRLCSVSTGCS